MSSPQVLRIARKNGSGHLLVHITPEGETLDLKLIGTDTDILFATSIKESACKKHQASNYSGSLAEWKSILALVLLHERPEGPLPDHLKGVDIVAEIVKSTFTITIRKIVGAITQTLGRVELQQCEVEVDLFGWIDAAAASSDRLRSQLQKFQTASTEQQNQIARLTAELDQLSKAKRDHEQDLLSKCAALLNEKKLKIRDQQRLLSHSKVDPDIAEDVKGERSKDPKSRRAGPSRSKRKADDEEDDHALSGDEEQTPADSDVETADDASDDDGPEERDGFAPAPAASQASNRRSTAPHSQSQASQRMNVDEPLPPARQLPFTKPKAGGPTPPASSSNQQAADEEDDETDDEL